MVEVTTPAVATDDTVTIDNVEYKITDLTENQQRLIGVYKAWKDEELVVQQDLMKLQAAQREMAREIVLDVRRTLEAQAAAEAAAAEKASEDKAPVEAEVPAEADTATDPVEASE